MKKIKFMLDGCDICFLAEAPADITLEALLKQCDRIVPDYCACGIRSFRPDKDADIIDLSFDYDDVHKTSEYASCTILPKKS